MNIVSGVRSLSSPLSKSVVTVGNFDGLHLGHRKIISLVKSEAKRLGGSPVVFTFDPHPRQVLFPEQALRRLFPQQDLIEQLGKEGVGTLISEPFSRSLSELQPDIFLREYIYKPLNPLAVVVGYDFSFGTKRKGTLSLLEDLAKKWGFEAQVVSPQTAGGAVISSTRIRQAILTGDVELAAECLGRPFYLAGLIERGDGRGRQIGFPTANLKTSFETIPAHGVYAGRISVRGKEFCAVTNVGTNPTFVQGVGCPTKVEIHVLDYQGDLYGENVRFEFANRLREEKKFSSVDELVTQIRFDVEKARSILKG